jgi:hypothetical protein
MDDHFRASVVPSRTHDAEPALLWDGQPALTPLRVVAADDPESAAVVDAAGRELRRFVRSQDRPATTGGEARAEAEALVAALERMRTGLSAAPGVTGPPRDREEGFQRPFAERPERVPVLPTGMKSNKRRVQLPLLLLSMIIAAAWFAVMGRSVRPGRPTEVPTRPRYQVVKVDRTPELLNRDQVASDLRSNYPSLLRDAGVGGTVVVSMVINEDGSPDITSVEVVSSDNEQFTERRGASSSACAFVPPA